MQAIVTPHKHLRIVIATVVALFALVVGIAMMRPAHAVGSGDGEHIITVHDDGVDKGFVTKASTVRDALKDGDIRLDAKDRTEPALDEKLVANSYQVNIYRARPVLIRDSDKELTVVTSYRTGKQIAADAHVTLQAEDEVTLGASSDPIADGAAEVMTITRATQFTFIFYGKTEIAYTQAKTIGEMLTTKGITLTSADRTSSPLGSTLSAGMTVRLWREGVQTVTQDEDIAFTTKQIKDANRDMGYKEVQTLGQNGRRTVTYQVTTKDGVEIARQEINSNVTKAAVEQVEIIGVKGVYTTPSENETITWNFLIAKGLTREQTAGIMGNLMQEHKFNTSGDGIAQWTGGRKAALMTLPYPDSIYTQLNFMWSELTGGYARALAAVKASVDVEGAVIAFQDKYEGCGVCREDLRLQYAYNILASH